MPGWDDELREVAREFIGGGEERVAQLRRALEEVERLPTEPRPLSELRRHFHRLAGAAGTFGLGEVSELARAAERLCAQTETHGGGPPEMVRAEWHQVVDRIEAAFRAARCEPATGDASAASVRAAARNGRQVREAADILVADDDESIRDLLSRLFRQEGLSVRAVGTMAAAAAAVDAAMPDGLVVDIELPDGSGYALVEDLRSRPGGDLPPVVMVSLKSGFLDRTEAIHAGADAFFEKPLDWEALVRKLQQLLDRGGAEAPCVLVVEDDADYAAFVRATLESAGYLVEVCREPLRFSEALAAFRPDLIVMDIVLPDVSGYDLARYVRQDDQYVTLPIVFLTGEAQLAARIDTVKAGGDDFLVKPVLPALLVASVAARLERARFLKTLLNRDGLTRLLTHSSFMERAQAVVAHKLRHAGPSAALVFIDLDHFKTVNDTHGHQAGDRVLVALSGVLRRHLRRSDVVGRYGGEEFAVVLDQIQEDDAVRLMLRLLDEFAAIEHRASTGAGFHATFSAGIAMFDPATMDLERWIQAADAALYRAKRAGRNRVMTHTERVAALRPGTQT